jgi:hypothetical protein
MSWAGILLLVGTAVFILIYRFGDPIIEFVRSIIDPSARSGSPVLGSFASMESEDPQRRRIHRRRIDLPIREIMAVLCSIVFGAWALYVLMAHPDSIIGGPIYDPATKQAATGALGAIRGLWLGTSME